MWFFISADISGAPITAVLHILVIPTTSPCGFLSSFIKHVPFRYIAHVHRGYYMAAGGYKIPLRLLKNIKRVSAANE